MCEIEVRFRRSKALVLLLLWGFIWAGIGSERAGGQERTAVAVVPLRDMRQGKDATREGIGLSRYLKRDIALLRPDLDFVPAEQIQPCLAEISTAYPTEISPREIAKLVDCLEPTELFWGRYGAYEDRISIFLDHWLKATDGRHRYEASGPREEVFATLDRLALEVGEQFGWKISREQKLSLQERETDSFPAYLDYWEGREKYAEGDYEKAAELFGKAAEEDPPFFRARFFTANTHLRQGEEETARMMYKELTEQYPSFIPAFVNLAAAYNRMGKPRWTVRLYRRAEGGEDSPPLLLNLGNAYRLLEMDTETRDAYAAAIRLAPEFADAYYQLAMFYKSRGVIDRARENFLQARKHRAELTQEIFDLGLPLKDILIEDDESYQAEIASDAVRFETGRE